jgi:hypothetical protein
MNWSWMRLLHKVSLADCENYGGASRMEASGCARRQRESSRRAFDKLTQLFTQTLK